RLPVVLVERDSDQTRPACAGADAMRRRQSGQVGREQDRFRVRAELVVELVCLADRSVRLDQRLRSEQEWLDRPLGDRGQREHNRWPLVAHGSSLAGGIGAARAPPLSRSRSSLASELASASAVASEGSGSASVTGTEAEALSIPVGPLPTASTWSPRAIAFVRACPLPLP